MPTNPGSVPRGLDTNSQRVVRAKLKAAGMEADESKKRLAMAIYDHAMDEDGWGDEKASRRMARRSPALALAWAVLKDAAGGGDGVPLDRLTGAALAEIATIIDAPEPSPRVLEMAGITTEEG